MSDKPPALDCLRLQLDQHALWLEAQKRGGYAAPVVELKTREVIDLGRPGSKNDGLNRH